MSFVRVAVTNEMWQPLASMVVECFNLDDPTVVIATVTTDTGGIAIFTALPSTGRFFFKARVTRQEGKFGEKSLYGEAKIQILGSSGATCYDAVVEPTGQFGTHTTIQAAIDAFATGNVGSTRPAFIAVKPAGDLVSNNYAETLTFTSTRRYVLHGCAQASGWMGNEFSGTTNLTNQPAVIVRSPVAGNRTITSSGAGTGQLEMSGFLIQAPATATVAYTFVVGAMVVKLFNCVINSALTGAVQAGTGSSYFFNECQIGSITTRNALDMGLAADMAATDCLFVGRVDMTTATGARLDSCVVRAENATQVVDMGNANTGTSWRLVNCYLLQTGAGNGILIRGTVAATDRGAVVVGNYIRGDAAEVGTQTAIVIEATVDSFIVASNLLDNWDVGIG